MYARAKLAVMDHNSGINQQQAKTKKGELRYKTVYSRITSSWVAKKIMEKKDKVFIKDIMARIWLIGYAEYSDKNLNLEEIPSNIAKVPNPGKKVVVDSHTSRFMKKI